MAVVCNTISIVSGEGSGLCSLGSAFTPPPAPPGYEPPGPPSLDPTFIIPAQDAYRPAHTVVITDLTDDTEIELNSFSIATDEGSVCWTLNAQGRPDLFARFTTANAVISIVIDGMEWQFVIEGVTRGRSFGATGVSLTGRSVTMLAAEPYAFPQNWINEGPATAAQLVDFAQVYTQMAVVWLIGDWLVPDKVWSFSGSPMAVAQRVAESVSALVVSDRKEFSISILPRYKYLPNQWPVVAPDVEIHAEASMTDSYQRADKPAFNSVFVSGQQQGAVGRIYLTGTAADKVAPLVTDLLLTDIDAIRQRGEAILGASGAQARVTMTLPVLTGTATLPGVLELNQLCHIVGDGTDWWGMVRSVSVDVSFPSVLQTVTFERHTAAIDYSQ